MKLHHLLRITQKGYSLVEMTIAVGLIGIGAVAVISLSENINSNTQKAEAMMAKSQFASAFGQHLKTSFGCTDLSGSSIATDPGSANEITIRNWRKLKDKMGNDVTSLGQGTEFKNFTVESIKAHFENLADSPVITINGVAHRRTNVIIRTKLKLSNVVNRGVEESGAGKKEYDYLYSIPVLADSSNRVTRCNEGTTIEETCVAMKGNYDPATKTCELEKTCKLKGTYQILSCSPSGSCSTLEGTSRANDQSGGFNCPAGSVSNHTGTKTWTHTVSCGKKCTREITNNMRWYSCLECPPSTTTTSPPRTTTGGSGGGRNRCNVRTDIDGMTRLVCAEE